MRTNVIRWIAVALWAAVIFAFSAQPGSAIPGGYSIEGHLGEYAIFGALLAWALWPLLKARYAVLLAVVVASAYGVTDELHQAFVPGRTPDVFDWGLDTMGAIAGACVIGLLLWQIWKRRSAPGQPAG